MLMGCVSARGGMFECSAAAAAAAAVLEAAPAPRKSRPGPAALTLTAIKYESHASTAQSADRGWPFVLATVPP